jgi:N-acetylglutamate synthase-like GNAT family acetyltransferase
VVAPAAAGRARVSELVRLINAAYAAGEVGLWLDDTGRTDEGEIAAAVRAGEMLVATIDGRTVGCARVRALDATTGEVGLVAVGPEAWGSGVGGRLMRTAENLMRTRGATSMRLVLLVPRGSVHPAKQRLHDWYTRLGYTVVGSQPFEDAVPHAAPHLATPCDLLLFRKPLTP